jgi:hypothetical protein
VEGTNERIAGRSLSSQRDESSVQVFCSYFEDQEYLDPER